MAFAYALNESWSCNPKVQKSTKRAPPLIGPPRGSRQGCFGLAAFDHQHAFLAGRDECRGVSHEDILKCNIVGYD